jgi:hypothetical protein
MPHPFWTNSMAVNELNPAGFNERTLQAVKDALAHYGVTRYDSLQDAFKDLGLEEEHVPK